MSPAIVISRQKKGILLGQMSLICTKSCDVYYTVCLLWNILFTYSHVVIYYSVVSRYFSIIQRKRLRLLIICVCFPWLLGNWFVFTHEAFLQYPANQQTRWYQTRMCVSICTHTFVAAHSLTFTLCPQNMCAFLPSKAPMLYPYSKYLIFCLLLHPLIES